jgi:hypothetical protein
MGQPQAAAEVPEKTPRLEKFFVVLKQISPF